MTAHTARGHVALVVLLGTIWGLNWPIVKIALLEFGPWTMRAVSLVGASLLLMLVAVAQRKSLQVRLSDWWRIVVPGVTGIAGVNILNAFAQMNMSTGRTAIITFSMPIWATLFSIVFLKENLDRRKLLGLLLGVAGLFALSWPLIRDGAATIGLTLAFSSALSWAFSLIFMKRFPISAPPIVSASWQVASGAACLVVGMLAFETMPPTFKGLTSGLMALVYNAVLAQAAGTLLWFHVVGRTTAGIAAIGTLMVPAIGMIGAIFILHEIPIVTDWIGLVLVLAASASVLVKPMRYGRFGAETAIAPSPGTE